MDAGGDLHVAQEGRFKDAVSQATGPIIGRLAADRVATIGLQIDLTTRTASAAVDDVATPIDFLLPDAPFAQDPAFTGVMFGIVPGFTLDPKGTLWMDDVSVQ